MATHTGRHFLQIPGPTNVPDRVLRAIDMPTIDHRGPEFAELGLQVLEGLQDHLPHEEPGGDLSRRPAPARGRRRSSMRCRRETRC